MLLNFKFTFEFCRVAQLKFASTFCPSRGLKFTRSKAALFADRRERLADKFLRLDLVYYGEREVCVADVAFAFTV